MNSLSFSICGFTLVRNAIKAGYPFREAVRSILPFCQSFVINVGDSEDATQEWVDQLVQENPQIKWKIIHSQWNTTHRQGGLVLSEETNRALKECEGDWCFYIQADEVIHEDDYDNIEAALKQAQKNPSVDALKFYWKHFAGSLFTYEASKGYYNQEIRLFKNHRQIESWGDAQSFRKQSGEKFICETVEADVFHYSHAKSEEKMLQKIEVVGKWWHSDEELKGKQKQWIKKKVHRLENLIVYEKKHPQVMDSWIRESNWSLQVEDFLLKGVHSFCILLPDRDKDQSHHIIQILKQCYPVSSIQIILQSHMPWITLKRKTFDIVVDFIGGVRSFFFAHWVGWKVAGLKDKENLWQRYDIKINVQNRDMMMRARPLRSGEFYSRALARLGCTQRNRVTKDFTSDERPDVQV